MDFNPAVLEAAKTSARAEALTSEFRLQDLRSLDLEEQYDAVICLWTSIGYFSDAENERTLSNLARALKPGGYLFLDAAVLESVCSKFLPRRWSWWGEGEQRVRVCQENRWDCARSRIEGTWSFLRGGQEVSRTISLRVYSCRELVDVLQRSGLSDFDCQGDQGEAFQIGSARLWLECRKPAAPSD